MVGMCTPVCTTVGISLCTTVGISLCTTVGMVHPGYTTVGMVHLGITVGISHPVWYQGGYLSPSVVPGWVWSSLLYTRVGMVLPVVHPVGISHLWVSHGGYPMVGISHLWVSLKWVYLCAESSPYGNPYERPLCYPIVHPFVHRRAGCSCGEAIMTRIVAPSDHRECQECGKISASAPTLRLFPIERPVRYPIVTLFSPGEQE